MRRFLALLILPLLAMVSLGQGRLNVPICEADGSPCIYPTRITVTNGTLTRSGGTAIIDTGGSDIVPELDVFLIAGQSNATGQATDGGSPTVATGTVLQYTGGAIVAGNDPVGACSASFESANTGSAWPAFGINYYQKTGRKVLIVSCAKGATSVLAAADTCCGNWSSTGALRAAAVSATQAALTAATAAGYVPTLRGIIWIQGEKDAAGIDAALGGVTAANYATEFTALRSYLRTQLGNAHLPFYISIIASLTTGDTAGYQQIRQQQVLAATESYTKIGFGNALSFIGRSLMKDTVHYNQVALNELGENLAANIFNTSNSLFITSGVAKVGVNNYAPLATLDVTEQVPIVGRETLGRFMLSDGGNSQLIIGNGTSGSSSYLPVLLGYFDANATTSSLAIEGFVAAGNDASDSATPGIVELTVARTTSATDPLNGTITAVSNRKIFTINPGSGTRTLSFTAAGALNLGSVGSYGFSNGAAATGTIDAAFVRRGTNFIGASDGSTGIGFLGFGRPVSAKTTGYTVVSTDTNTFFTNIGASGSVTFTLPSPSAGMTYEFYRSANQTIVVDVGGSVVIRAGASATTSGGDVTLDAVGSKIKITAVSATEWAAEVVGSATFN